ncbi:hypothetical protein EWP20_12525 [Neisseria meningitidis]|nr:hypothetical protein [Neisseria meningitidis]MBG8594986.1 hypothetical protein [Neisseria meningitidis]MBG8598195.1 hypothetical protein [Neisseria meningitidis]MBG8603854.1 hypothetical protein [Neisseria meningitidis]MBG8606067.1 hypothetical protein [Neisseria meningitidis]
MTIFKLLDLQSDLPIEIGCATYVLSRALISQRG